MGSRYARLAAKGIVILKKSGAETYFARHGNAYISGSNASVSKHGDAAGSFGGGREGENGSEWGLVVQLDALLITHPDRASTYHLYFLSCLLHRDVICVVVPVCSLINYYYSSFFP